MRSQRLAFAALVVAVAGIAVGAPPSEAHTSATAPAGAYVAVPATRLLDTSTGVGAPKATVAGGNSVAVTFAGKAGIPASGVSSVALTITASAATADGTITAYASGTTRPTYTTTNFRAGITSSKTAIVPIGSDGKITFYVTSTGRTQVAADVSGYFVSGSVSGAALFTPVTPVRVLDTRTGTGAGGSTSPVGGGGNRQPKVVGLGAVPATGVGAVAIKVSSVSATASGTVTVHPGGAQPAYSTLAFATGITETALTVVDVSDTGTVELDVISSGSTHLVAEVVGYYRSGEPAVAGSTARLSPYRLLDTRTGLGAPKAVVTGGSTLPVKVAGVGDVPAGGAGVALLKITSIGATKPGVLTAFATGAARPATANVSWPGGGNVSNLALVPIGSSGSVSIYVASSGSTHLAAEVIGYVRSTAAPAWTLTTLPSPPKVAVDTGLADVSCPADGTCFAVGSKLISKLSGGTWTTTTAPVPVGSRGVDLVGVSCVSTSSCVAVGRDVSSDSDVVVSTYNGTSWSSKTVPLRGGYDSTSVVAISCGVAGSCVIVGDWTAIPDQGAYALTQSGSSWQYRELAASGFAQALDVSCVSTTCRVVDTEGDVISGFGSTWSSQQLSLPNSQTPSLHGISCVSTTGCVATATDGFFRYNGTAWTFAAAPNVSLDGVSCTSTTVCGATGTRDDTRAFVRVAINGSTATATNLVAASGTTLSSVPAIACRTTGGCVAVGGDVVGGHLRPVAFASTSSWTATSVPTAALSTTGTLDSVACASATSCVAIGGAGGHPFAIKGSGASWSAATTLPLPGGATTATIGGFDCASSTFCVAVGSYQAADNSQKRLVERYNGSTWTASSPAGPAGGSAVLTDVSCGSATTCIAVDDARGSGGRPVAYTIGASGTPTTTLLPAALSADQAVVAVSCPAASSCAAVTDVRDEEDPTIFRLAGGTWTAANSNLAAADLIVRPSDLACVTPQRCVAVVAVNFNDHVAQTAETRVINATSADEVASVEPHAVGCAGSYCLSVGGTAGLTADELLDKAGALSPSATPGGYVAASFYAVECTGIAKCVAVGDAVAADGGIVPLVATLN